MHYLVKPDVAQQSSNEIEYEVYLEDPFLPSLSYADIVARNLIF
jgi:hypothetical protein